jgi:hypothetical protein
VLLALAHELDGREHRIAAGCKDACEATAQQQGRWSEAGTQRVAVLLHAPVEEHERGWHQPLQMTGARDPLQCNRLRPQLAAPGGMQALQALGCGGGSGQGLRAGEPGPGTRPPASQRGAHPRSACASPWTGRTAAPPCSWRQRRRCWALAGSTRCPAAAAPGPGCSQRAARRTRRAASPKARLRLRPARGEAPSAALRARGGVAGVPVPAWRPPPLRAGTAARRGPRGCEQQGEQRAAAPQRPRGHSPLACCCCCCCCWLLMQATARRSSCTDVQRRHCCGS